MNATLGQIASLVRSKNAGPFWMTVDVFFDDESSYRRAAASALTDPATIAKRYGVAAEHVTVYLLATIGAIKISFPRPIVQGSVHDRDLHAGQQYVPLLDMEIP